MSRPQPRISDWLSRVTIPDVYPRLDDPFQPGVSLTPGNVPEVVYPGDGGAPVPLDVTEPAARPYAYQNSVSYQLTATTPAVPLLVQSFPVDAITIDNYSTALASVFFGRGNQITPTTGIEVQPGIPETFRTDNNREMWELQRSLEYIAAMLAVDRGLPPLGKYRAPRVVFDASKYFLVAAAATTVSVTLWYIPEHQ